MARGPLQQETDERKGGEPSKFPGASELGDKDP